MYKVKVEVEQDNCGWLHVNPAGAKRNKAIRRYLREMGESLRTRDAVLFIQGEGDIDAFLADLTGRARASIRGGWLTVVLMDEWSFLTMVGYDANQAQIKGW